MNFFGFFVSFIFLLSLVIGYNIFKKIAKTNRHSNKKNSFLGNTFLILFISIVMVTLNAITFITSYSFFWEKAYGTMMEDQYEAIVVGYEKNVSKTQNFRGSSYDDAYIFFPQAKYRSHNGKIMVKTLDITSNKPFEIGAKVKITDKKGKEKANTLNLNWGIFIFGAFFTGVSAFFTALLSTYTTNSSFMKRVKKSAFFGVLIFITNLCCVLILYKEL